MKNLSKRVLLVLFALLMVVVFAACDPLGSPNNGGGKNETTESGNEEDTLDTREESPSDSTGDDTRPPQEDGNGDETLPPELHERESVYIEMRGSSGFYVSLAGMNEADGMTLAELVEANFEVTYEMTIADGDWYLNYEPANGDTVITAGCHLIYQEKGVALRKPVIDPEDAYTYVNFFFSNVHPLTMQEIKVDVKELTLIDFVNEVLPKEGIFNVPYAESLDGGEWYINGERASGNTLIEDGNTVSYYTIPGSGSGNEDSTVPPTGTALPDDEDHTRYPEEETEDPDRPGGEEKPTLRPGLDEDGDGVIDGDAPDETTDPTVTTAPENPGATGSDDEENPPAPIELSKILFTWMCGEEILFKGEIIEEFETVQLDDFVDRYLPRHIDFEMSFRDTIRQDGVWLVNDEPANAKTMLQNEDYVIFIENDEDDGEEDLPGEGEESSSWGEDTDPIETDSVPGEDTGRVPEDDTTKKPEDNTWTPEDDTTRVPDEESSSTPDVILPDVPGETETTDPDNGEDLPSEPADTIDIYVTIGADGETMRFEVSRGITLAEFVDVYLKKALRMSYEESCLYGTWELDASPVESADEPLTDDFYEISYYSDTQDDTDHEHVWNSLHECEICGIPCTHDAMKDFTCPECGFTTGGGEAVVNVTFEIFVEGETLLQMYPTVRDDLITIRRLFDEIIEESASWDDINSYYDVTVDGSYVDGDFEMSAAQEYWRIILTSRDNVDLPEMFREFSVEGSWYIASEDGRYDCKHLYTYVDREMTVAQLLEYLYIDVSDYSTLNCYLNNEWIEDIYSYVPSYDDAIDGVCYLVIVPKTVRFSFTFTVTDKTVDEATEQVYSFTYPIYWGPFSNALLEGKDPEAVRFKFPDGEHGMIYEEAYCESSSFEIVWQERTVYIDRVNEKGEVEHLEIVVTGAAPTLKDFAREYLGIDDFDAYYFYDPKADFASSQNGAIKHYVELMVIPKSVVADEIKIEYEVKLRDDDVLHKGTLVLNAPEMLHTAFYQSDVGFSFLDVSEAGGYKFCIDGVLVDNADDKETHYILVYRDIKLVVEPVYNVYVFNEDTAEERVLKFENGAVTLEQIAELLGVEFEHYKWRLNGLMVGEKNAAIADFSNGYDEWMLNLIPKYIAFDVEIFNAYGDSVHWFGTEYTLYSVTAEQLLALILECGYDPSDYRVFYVNLNGGEPTELTDDMVFTYPEEYEDNRFSFSIQMKEISDPITLVGIQNGNEIYTTNGFFKSGMRVDEILERNFVDRENIKTITYKKMDGESVTVTLEDVLTESGSLVITYRTFYYIKVSVDRQTEGWLEEMIETDDLSITFGMLAEKFGADFESYMIVFDNILIQSPDEVLADYVSMDNLYPYVYITKLQIEVNVEMYGPEFSYDLSGFSWNSEKAFGAPARMGEIAAFEGFAFEDYTWYLYDENWELISEITDPDTLLEYRVIDGGMAYTYYNVKAVSKAFSVTVELYIDEVMRDEAMLYYFDSPIAASALLEQLGYTWDDIMSGFVDRRYRDGEDLCSDTVLDGPSKVYLYVNSKTEY